MTYRPNITAVSKYDSYLERYRGFFTESSPSRLREIAHAKRYLERFTGDQTFRNGVLTGVYDLQLSASDCGCDLDVQSLLPILHPDFQKYRSPDLIDDWPLAKLWDDYIRFMVGMRQEILMIGDSNGFNPAYDQWRARQVGRVACDIGMAGVGLVHPPVAFELSSGCSVGCWFCGISAEKFKGHFSLQSEGRDAWLDILKAVQSVIGEALRSSFLYWATDPLDNPEYPDFLDCFFEINGAFPQTTTAIPLRNVELTRAVLERWHYGKGYPNRFSILNTKILTRVHEEFTPEELLGVELVLQNLGNSTTQKTNAGRTYKLSQERGDSQHLKGFNLGAGTIACVSGFLINLVERTIRLVSPCMPSDKWPNGYIVFDQRTYQTPSELAAALTKMIERHMPVDMNPRSPIQLSENMHIEPEGDGFVLKASICKIESPLIDQFAAYLHDSAQTPMEILKAAVENGKNPFAVIDAIRKSRDAGLLDNVVPRML